MSGRRGRRRQVQLALTADAARLLSAVVDDARKEAPADVVLATIALKLDTERKQHPRSMTVRLDGAEAAQLANVIDHAVERARLKSGYFAAKLADDLGVVADNLTRARTEALAGSSTEGAGTPTPTLFEASA